MGIFKKLQFKRETGEYITEEEKRFIIANDSSEQIKDLFKRN